MPFISVVSPVYNAEKTLLLLVERVESVLLKTTSEYEIILVEDGGPDDSWSIINNLAKANNKILGIKLSRNFGQHNAITAGLSYASGEWVIVMDCDLQDVPEEIPRLLQKAEEGYDIVLAKRQTRKDHFFKKLSSRLFYATFSYLTETKQDHTVANFGIYHKRVINAILSMGDEIRYFPTMVQWVGFKKTAIEVEHAERAEGKSSYTFKKLLLLAFNNIIAFSDKPLRLTIKFGLSLSILSMFVGFYYLFLYFSGRITEVGFTSLIISLWFLAGIIILILGILGIYLGKAFEKIKNRPTFIISHLKNAPATAKK